VRIKRVVLEHHGDVPLLGSAPVDAFPADAQFAVAHRLQAGEDAQHRGFSAARRTDDDEKLAIHHVEGEVLQRDGISGEHLGHVFEFDICHDQWVG